MPQWSVTGADRKSGFEISLLVEAPSEPKAREVASQRGILVAEVRLSDPDTVAPATLAYQAPVKRSRDPYWPFVWAAWVFRFITLLLVVALLLYLADAARRLRSAGPSFFSPPFFATVLQDLALILVGIAASLFAIGLCKLAHRYATTRLA